MNVSIVGATGLVGDMFLRTLEERDYPVSTILPYATEKSAGVKVHFKGKNYTVKRLQGGNIKKCELAFFSGGAKTAKRWAGAFRDAGALVVDNSSAFRGDNDVPLVVPEVNPDSVRDHHGIISNPNCSTIGMVVALNPLHRAFSLKSVIVTSFQSVSGAGRDAVMELERQQSDNHALPQVFPRRIAGNCLPQIGEFLHSGETVEERKFRDESRKIMNLPELEVCATAVRVPVTVGHSLSIHARFSRPVNEDEALELLASAPGIRLFSSPDEYPTPLEVAGMDLTLVGRVRSVPGFDRSLNLWVVVDNLRKGAATNAVQIAEIALLNKAAHQND